jgi:hypothetical protein
MGSIRLKKQAGAVVGIAKNGPPVNDAPALLLGAFGAAAFPETASYLNPK